jgi:predicted nucleic acid-binding protein
VDDERNERESIAPGSVVADTNVFVAAAFERRSASARLLERSRAGEPKLVWSDATRAETEFIVGRIPPLRSFDLAPYFTPDGRFEGPLDPSAYAFVVDPADRPFLALAEATGADLVTNDVHLLEHRARAGVRIVTPGEYERGFAP